MKKSLIKFLMWCASRAPYIQDSVAFYSYPDYSDSSRYLYEYIFNLGDTAKEFNLTWLISQKEVCQRLSQHNIACSYLYSINGIKQLLFSKIIFATHEIVNLLDSFVPKNKKQIIVYLNHGIPMKSYRLSTTKNLKFIHRVNKYYDIAVASTEFTAFLLSAFKGLAFEKFHITGSPRHYFISSINRRTCLEILSKLGIKIEHYDKIILYAPTCRMTAKGYQRKWIRGKPNSYLGLLKGENSILKVLERYNALLIVKPHPFEEPLVADKLVNMKSDRIYVLTSKDLQRHLIDINFILPCIDILITDYSSIGFDFLVTKRPIIYYFYDYYDYIKYSPLLLTPPEYFLPGPVMYDFSSLLDVLVEYIEDESSWRKSYASLHKLYVGDRYMNALSNIWNEVCKMVD